MVLLGSGPGGVLEDGTRAEDPTQDLVDVHHCHCENLLNDRHAGKQVNLVLDTTFRKKRLHDRICRIRTDPCQPAKTATAD